MLTFVIGVLVGGLAVSWWEAFPAPHEEACACNHPQCREASRDAE